MDTPMVLLVLAFAVVFAIVGAWLSEQKHRSGWEGLILGFLFGPLGVIFAGLAPTLPPKARKDAAPPAWVPPPLSPADCERDTPLDLRLDVPDDSTPRG